MLGLTFMEAKLMASSNEDNRVNIRQSDCHNLPQEDGMAEFCNRHDSGWWYKLAEDNEHH